MTGNPRHDFHRAAALHAATKLLAAADRLLDEAAHLKDSIHNSAAAVAALETAAGVLVSEATHALNSIVHGKAAS